MPNQRPKPFRRRPFVIIKPLVILTRIAMVQVMENGGQIWQMKVH